jgi:hypothetical protein
MRIITADTAIDTGNVANVNTQSQGEQKRIPTIEAVLARGEGMK